MSADEGRGSGSVTVLCCVAFWNDRRVTRRSLVVLPPQGEDPASYAARRLRPHEQLAKHDRRGFGYWSDESNPAWAEIHVATSLAVSIEHHVGNKTATV